MRSAQAGTTLRRPLLRPLLPVAMGLLLMACAPEPRHHARGIVLGQLVETGVDSPLARAYVQAEAPLPPAAELPAPADREGWRELAARTSLDAASLLLAAAIAAEPPNACWRAGYEARLAALRAGHRPAVPDADALILAVPGWRYIANPATGADLAGPRRLLGALGVANELVATVENGSVLENARIVAAAVRARANGRPLVLVSASKGGAEVAEALGHLLTPLEAQSVRAWVNVGGLLRGTALADLATTWPTRWLAALHFAIEGIAPGDGVSSLRTDVSDARLARQTLPAGLRVVNYIGIPLSGHIERHTAFGYRQLARYGPNDALTPIADALAHGGVTIAEIGLDHYFADPEIDLKTVALALLVLEEVAYGAAACPRPTGPSRLGRGPASGR